jgi:hypothetical protein
MYRYNLLWSSKFFKCILIVELIVSMFQFYKMAKILDFFTVNRFNNNKFKQTLMLFKAKYQPYNSIHLKSILCRTRLIDLMSQRVRSCFYFKWESKKSCWDFKTRLCLHHDGILWEKRNFQSVFLNVKPDHGHAFTKAPN